jgi:hypothetical protein
MNAPFTLESRTGDDRQETTRRPAPVLTWVRRTQPASTDARVPRDEDGPPPEEPGYGHGV